MDVQFNNTIILGEPSCGSAAVDQQRKRSNFNLDVVFAQEVRINGW